jgi:hypothetical protein
MGQAKQRGTYEQRKAEGIAKRKARELEQAKLRMIRESRISKSQLPAVLMVAGMAMSTMPKLGLRMAPMILSQDELS